MKFFTKIRALFQAPAPTPTAPAPYTDEEFLNAVMEQVRRRPHSEPAAHQVAATTVPLPKAA